jgi:hypothetical protein
VLLAVGHATGKHPGTSFLNQLRVWRASRRQNYESINLR